MRCTVPGYPRVLAVAAAATLWFATAAAAETMWVGSRDASLKAEPTATSETLAKLATGTEVTVVEEDGKWYRITLADGVAGWIYRGKLKAEKPEVEEEENLFGAALESNIGSEDADTSRSIRGLSPEAEAYANETGSPVEHRKALDWIVSLHPKGDRVEQFLKNGRIGEYAE